VNKPEKMPGDERRDARSVFVSYATADRKQALQVTKAIEQRGTKCWISCRDVEPGENYQEAIVRSIREAPAMVLVFSEAANNSDEIKKELSLASRYHIPLMALRIEDVEPSDAFAYELSTRQWIDAFEGWDKSIDALVQSLDGISGVPATRRPEKSHRKTRMGFSTLNLAISSAAILLVMTVAIGAWLVLRGTGVPQHSMMVRLAGFQRLSPDIPATMPQALDEEIIAAFGEDGIVGASTAHAAAPGSGPAYALSGTIRREGDTIKIIAQLANERSGATLWSDTFNYDASRASQAPRLAAVRATIDVRCGLFGAFTYTKPLTDQTLQDYFGFCESDRKHEFTKGLDFAHKVVAAVPGFSWGWSAVEKAAARAELEDDTQRESLRNEALAAADRAIALDASNSEAYAYKSLLIDPNDLAGREALLKKALAARPLACGCEHDTYANFLDEVGRIREAIGEYRRSTDVLPLNPGSQIGLAGDLLMSGRPEEAQPHLNLAYDLSGSDAFRAQVMVENAILLDDYTGGLRTLSDPALQMPAQLKSAIATALKALQSNNPQAKKIAAAELIRLPPDMGSNFEIWLLGALGENAAALHAVEIAIANNNPYQRSQLFVPSLIGALRDPSFPAVAQRVGLTKYWRTTHTKPDVCSARDAPPVCRMI
jgi:tetratricopeptide (TPR) repeat protein